MCTVPYAAYLPLLCITARASRRDSHTWEVGAAVRACRTWPGRATRRSDQLRRTPNTAYDHYAGMDASDGRDWSNLDVRADVAVGSIVIVIEVDVVVEDTHGYVGRLLLCDRAPMTLERAELPAVPPRARRERRALFLKWPNSIPHFVKWPSSYRISLGSNTAFVAAHHRKRSI